MAHCIGMEKLALMMFEKKLRQNEWSVGWLYREQFTEFKTLKNEKNSGLVKWSNYPTRVSL